MRNKVKKFLLFLSTPLPPFKGGSSQKGLRPLPHILKISIIFFLILSAGCTHIHESKVKTAKIIKFSSWGSESEVKVIKPLIREFEKQNPEIKVDFIHIPKNYFQKMHLMVASNLTPDVVFINNLSGPLYAGNNVFLDLSGYLKNDDTLSKKDFFPQALEAFTYKGKFYAIPRDISNLVIYYNKDLFDKYHVAYPKKNWTFEEFLLTSRKLTKDLNADGKIDQFGVSFEEAPLFWLPFLWSNGGGIINKNLDSIIIDKPASLEALQFYADLRNKYHAAPTKSEAGSATMAQLFMQQKVAMHISGRWSTPGYRKNLDFSWDTARFPRGKAGSVVDCDTSGWAISSSSKYPKESWRLIKFLANRKSAENFAQSGLIVPARIDAANSEDFLDKKLPPENSKVFVNIISDSVPTPVIENYQELTDILDSALEPLWLGEKTAKEVIDKNLIKNLRKKLK